MRCFSFCAVVILFNFFVTINGAAQTLRVKGGVNVATIGGDAKGNKYKMSFHGGIAGMLELSDELQVQPELVVSGQGTRPTEYITSNYWYANLPVLLAYKTSSYTLHFGPQVGLLLGARIRNNDTGSEEVVTSSVNNLDFSLAMGLELPLKNSFAVQARYNHGLSSTAKSNIAGEMKSLNRVFQLSLVFKLEAK